MVFHEENKRLELVGVTSVRNECLSEGIYTRTKLVNDWIIRLIENPPAPPTLPTIAPVTFPTMRPDQLGIIRLSMKNTKT